MTNKEYSDYLDSLPTIEEFLIKRAWRRICMWIDCNPRGTEEQQEQYDDMQTMKRALCKQIAKEPVKDREYTICPNCKRVEIDRLDNYCHGCGQRLDWTE